MENYLTLFPGSHIFPPYRNKRKAERWETLGTRKLLTEQRIRKSKIWLAPRYQRCFSRERTGCESESNVVKRELLNAFLNHDYCFLTLFSKIRNGHKYFLLPEPRNHPFKSNIYSTKRLWSDHNLLILPTSLTQQTLDAAGEMVVPSFASVRF